MNGALFNEIDPFAGRWLRNLIFAGHLARGTVDERSIEVLTPADLVGVSQFHAFAGIGVWSHAARLAGWPDDFELWTGSCPCQPFSDAGAGKGFDDERHLWPSWFELISECRPPVVAGEQVASRDGLAWLDAVQADMEGAGYAFAAFDLCAASVGAPHRRQRLYFGAVRLDGLDDTRRRLADHHEPGRRELASPRVHENGQRGDDAHGRSADGARLADAESERLQRGRPVEESNGRYEARLEPDRRRAARGPWADVEWVDCRDGKRRPTQPGLLPVAHGAPARVGRLRAYGNAIVGPLAEAFLRCLRDSVIAGEGSR